MRVQLWSNTWKFINVIHHINKLKEKNHNIISLNAEKAFDKFQHAFMLKQLEKSSIQGTYLIIIKSIYSKPIANNKLNVERFQPILLKLGQASLFMDDMIVYISNPKNSTRELLQLINTFNSKTGYKIIQKNQYVSFTQMINGLRKKLGTNTVYNSPWII